jgi:CubicO group peptidase (beta-lactamase class C family)
MSLIFPTHAAISAAFRASAVLFFRSFQAFGIPACPPGGGVPRALGEADSEFVGLTLSNPFPNIPPMTRLPMTRRSLLGTLAGTALSAPFLRAREATLQPADVLAMETAAKEVMKEYRIPGLSLAFAHHGKLVHSAAFGMANQDAGEKLTRAHRFRLASVSKPITSAAVFRLVEQGKLSLQNRIFGAKGLLPEYPATDPQVLKITLHHLLTHTCGGWGNSRNDPMFKNPKMNHQELIAWTLKHLPIEKEPGQTYAYSNFGYCLLGRVIEAVTGEKYEAHVKRHLLAPCGIAQMRIGGNTLAERQPLEVGYYGQQGGNPYGATINVRRMDSHGGWLASATDLIKLLVRLDGFPGPPDLLAPETIRLMTTASSANPGYACGWAVNRQPNWWHGGSLPGSATLAVRTATGMCWAVLANTRFRDPNQPEKNTAAALDRLMWKLARQVTAWGA